MIVSFDKMMHQFSVMVHKRNLGGRDEKGRRRELGKMLMPRLSVFEGRCMIMADNK